MQINTLFVILYDFISYMLCATRNPLTSISSIFVLILKLNFKTLIHIFYITCDRKTKLTVFSVQKNKNETIMFLSHS